MKYIMLFLFFLSGATLGGTPPIEGCKAASLACAGEIDKIYLHPNGSIKVPPPVGSNLSDMSCSLSEGVYLTIKRNHPHFKEMYSMLLTAHASSKKMYLRYVKDSPDCEVLYTVIY